MLRQDELAFKAVSTFQMSPALLKELRLGMARRKKKPAVPAGSAAPHQEAGPEPPNSSRESEKPMS